MVAAAAAACGGGGGGGICGTRVVYHASAAAPQPRAVRDVPPPGPAAPRPRSQPSGAPPAGPDGL